MQMNDEWKTVMKVDLIHFNHGHSSKTHTYTHTTRARRGRLGSFAVFV